ncbi:GABBR2, partial [Symbiodinium sp. KB8]
WLTLLVVVNGSTSSPCPALCTAADNSQWPCRYHATNCEIIAAANPARAGATEINVLVMSPYSGSTGDLMTMVEPALASATQDIENSNILPGYRLRMLLVDTKCNARDATVATVTALSTGVPKHIIFGDSCSSACEAINDAASFFNVLQVGPGCTSTSLSDSVRYPYFTRMAPSYRFNILAVYEFLKLLNFHRVGIVHGFNAINILAKDMFVELIQADVDSKAYEWAILHISAVTSAGNIPDAQHALAEMHRTDSRINFVALYADTGSMLLCQSYKLNMLSPDYIFIVASGWWNPGFILERAGAADCPCTAEELHRAAYGMLALDRGPMQQTNDLHELSGVRLADIYANYTSECSGFANGNGPCNHQWAAYFYDGLWLIAHVLHAYLVDGGRSISDLRTEASRQALYDLSLSTDFVGLTGIILFRQVVGSYDNAFNELAYRTDSGIAFKADIAWSPDPLHHLSCSTGTCDLSSGHVPKDRGDSCPDGTVFSVELGCIQCPPGEYATSGMQECRECAQGSFTDEPGMAGCTLCGAGTKAPFPRATSCQDCPAGQYMDERGASQCKKCPLGQYAENDGQQQCTMCPPGQTTSFEGAAELSVCTCDGFYYQQQCIKCAFGTRFEAGSCVRCDRTQICENGLVTGNATTDDEWGITIDTAGRQRTLSQIMTNEFLMVTLGIDVARHKKVMQDAMTLFQDTLEDLRVGNPQLQIIPAPSDDVRETIENELTERKLAMYELLNDNVDLSTDVSESVLHSLYIQNQQLFDLSNQVVSLLVDAAQSAGARLNGLLANTAGRQRSLIQKMLKNVLFVAKRVDVESNVEELRNNLDVFEASHSAILRGADWAGIPQLTRMCTIHQMKSVTFYYQEVRSLARKVFNARSQAESIDTALLVASNMSANVDPLAVAMSEAVKLYVNDPGDCDPLATITDSEWAKLLNGLAEQQITSQKIARLYMQVANNVMVEQSKVDLAVEVTSNTQSLTDLLEGSQASGMPAPPTQEMVDGFVAVANEWSMMSSVFNEAISLDQIPAVDVARIAILTERYQSEMHDLLVEVEQSALQAGSTRPLLLLDVIAMQQVRIQVIPRDAALIHYGYEVALMWERLNGTARDFHRSHRELMLGTSSTHQGTHRLLQTPGSLGMTLKRVSNVCLVRAMRLVEDEYSAMEIAAYQVARGDTGAFRTAEMYATAANDHMVEAAFGLERYYDNFNVTCDDVDLPAEDWQLLMEEVYGLCSLTQRAVGEFVLQDQGEILPDVLERTVEDVETSFESLMLGRSVPHLPAQPNQEVFSDVRDLDSLVQDFLEAITSQTMSGLSGLAASVCNAAGELGEKYLQGGLVSSGSNWPGRRAQALFQQIERSNMAFSSMVQNEATAMWEAINGFETTHSNLLNGGDGLPAILPERQDMKLQWEAIDSAWQAYKPAVTSGQGTGQITMTLDAVQAELRAAVPIFSIPDVVIAETSPWIFVATFGTMALILLCCSALGCFMYRSAHRSKSIKGGQDSQA